MGVWALGGPMAVNRGRFHDFHFEFDWQLLGRVAGAVVAGLIFQGASHGVFAWEDGVQGTNGYAQREVAAIDAQFLVGGEIEGYVLTGWIADFADYDVGRGVHTQSRRNHELLRRLIRIDVIAAGNVEAEVHAAGLAANDGGQRR